MAMWTERSELMGALSSLYNDGKYSDLTVICGESTYRVHKAVLCPRSQFFAKACDGGFKEASTGVIDLSQDDPQAAGCTRNNADKQPETSQHSITSPAYVNSDNEWEPMFSARPTHRVKKRKGRTARSVWGEPHNPEVTTWIRDPNLIIHAQVYALGELYAVEAIVLEKFVSEVEVHWATDDFLQAIEHVYNSTLEHDQKLKDVVRNVLYEHRRSLMMKEDVQRYLRNVPNLAYDVLMHVHKQGH